jgi:hypothetical protein
MWNMLKLDPGSYDKFILDFRKRLVESLVASRITIQPEFMRLVLVADRARCPLFTGLPSLLPSSWEERLSGADFISARLPMIQRMSFGLVRLSHLTYSEQRLSPHTLWIPTLKRLSYLKPCSTRSDLLERQVLLPEVVEQHTNLSDGC